MRRRLALVLALAASLAGCGSQPTQVTGTLTYRQRIALPPDAVATVRLVDASKQDAPSPTLAEQVIDPAGQVPIAFTLDYDPTSLADGHTVLVQARITAGGELLWLNTSAVPLTKKSMASPLEVILHQAKAGAVGDRGMPHMLAFDCGDTPYLITYDLVHDTATLYAPDGARLLAHQIAASGAKYGDDEIVVWTKGRELIRMERGGKAVGDCAVSARQRTLDEAWAAGYHFRAAGNEPFWSVSVSPDRVRVSLPSEPDLDFPGATPEDVAPGATLTVKADGHELRMSIVDALCVDSMSGWPYPATVDITLDGTTMHGCGVWLR